MNRRRRVKGDFHKVRPKTPRRWRALGRLIERLEPGPLITVRLNPDDLRELQERLAGEPELSHSQGEVHLVSDATLARGDCTAEAGDLGLVAKIDQQISDIRQLLLENLDDAQVEHRKTQPGNQGIRRYPDRRETA